MRMAVLLILDVLILAAVAVGSYLYFECPNDNDDSVPDNSPFVLIEEDEKGRWYVFKDNPSLYLYEWEEDGKIRNRLESRASMRIDFIPSVS